MQITTSYFLKKGYLIQPDLAEFINEQDTAIVFEILKSLNAPRIISLEFFKKNIKNIEKVLKDFLENKRFEESIVFNFINKIKSNFEDVTDKKAYIDAVKKENDNDKKTGFEETYTLNKFLIPKKVDVSDFINFFRDRFFYFRNLFRSRVELSNLYSLDKIPRNNQNLSVIGIVLEKRETKNRNILLVLEDTKGTARVLINKNRAELYEKALNIVEDEVIAVKGFGNREIIFASEIFFPEIKKEEIKKVKEDKNLIFISDIHVGSKMFLEKNFRKFIKWINGELGDPKHKEKAKKISHIFVNGDIIDGIGIYPGQEEELDIKDITEQYKATAELFSEIRQDVRIIFIPGNHDAVRLLEPQVFNDYAKALHSLKNAELLPNPTYYNVYGYRILLYHGYSLDFFANTVYALKKYNPYENPEALLKFLLIKRHLAPTHASTLYMPSDEDFFIIKKVPDIFITSHMHKTATHFFRNILLISTSCWQSRTPYQEKVGHHPDPCRVVIFNTKRRKVNIMDFS